MYYLQHSELSLSNFYQKKQISKNIYWADAKLLYFYMLPKKMKNEPNIHSIE